MLIGLTPLSTELCTESHKVEEDHPCREDPEDPEDLEDPEEDLWGYNPHYQAISYQPSQKEISKSWGHPHKSLTAIGLELMRS